MTQVSLQQRQQQRLQLSAERDGLQGKLAAATQAADDATAAAAAAKAEAQQQAATAAAEDAGQLRDTAALLSAQLEQVHAELAAVVEDRYQLQVRLSGAGPANAGKDHMLGRLHLCKTPAGHDQQQQNTCCMVFLRCRLYLMFTCRADV
jgi:hypothetical protein